MSNEKKEPITDETVVVELRGPSGNAFCVMGAVVEALRRNGHREMIADYRRKATSGDYENLLKVSGEYVKIEKIWKPSPVPRRKRRGRGAGERKTNMEITQREINRMAERIGKVSRLMQEVNAMALQLAKENNESGVLQLRGAFSGTLAAAQTTDGFLTGLVGVIDR